MIRALNDQRARVSLVRQPTAFVAKFCPEKMSGIVQEQMTKSMFGAEAHWYNDFLAEEIGMPRPEAYYVGARVKRRPWKTSPRFCML